MSKPEICHEIADTTEPIEIVVAEDDEDDRYFIQKAFQEARLVNKICFVENGEDLMDMLHRRGEFEKFNGHDLPKLILLDLNMPKKDGREALKEIKSDDKLKNIPVLVFTTSKEERDILSTYDLGANAFISKPVKFEEFIHVLQALGNFWFKVVTLPKTNSVS